MKQIFFLTTILFLSCVSTIGSAATPISDKMADTYFDNCISGAQKEGTMSTEGMNKYCACTAMNMQKAMTQEDLVDLSGTGQKQRNALNKMLLGVNGPCMQYPVHDMLFKQCMIGAKNPAVCGCLSTKMGDFMADISKRMMPELLADDPNLFDPMTPIMESQEFKMRQNQIAVSCATNPTQK